MMPMRGLQRRRPLDDLDGFLHVLAQQRDRSCLAHG
jgi:hypothetical protein